jgi:type I restriction enzyme S subunit
MCIDFTINQARRAGIHSIITGSGQPQITRANLEGLKVIRPALTVLTQYRDICSPGRFQRLLLTTQNQELTQLRDWLLPMLMNGQVTVGTTEN